ncbi:DUF5131 family protein [Synechococcus sp. PCC 7336]|uniref:DUF5131 family protein n=1 Tax=Synechococcus sp. PCC 7336 TaxID=195250 RepID=UPI00034BDD52|nr:phage Gp37/Gp68 family protein [Synechococcus sp. PCC 7336]
MRDSKIEWTDHTFNPWWGCTKVSPACDNCYAEAWAKRTGHSVWGHRAERRSLSDNYWMQPLVWDKEAGESGRKRVFCASMADVFEWRQDLNKYRRRLWQLIEDTPNLDWLLLTKRPHLAGRLTPWGDNWPTNVWLGTTVEDQAAALKRIPKLVESNARVKFLSCEPLLEDLDLSRWISSLSWVITGGETGSKARPTSPDWFRHIRDVCVQHNVPFHFKQWGDWFPAQEMGDQFVTKKVEVWYGEKFVKVGKKNTGRLLDELMWNQLPAT